MSTLTKKCFKCDQVKALDQFYKHSGMSDGRLGKCKECTKEDVRKNYKENKPRYQEYEKSRANLPHRIFARRAYARTQAGKDAFRRAKIAYIERNPIKRDAHNKVSNAIRDGKLTKQPCEVCGDEKVHAHHDDYAKPLDVRWLCKKHHNEWHNTHGEAANG